MAKVVNMRGAIPTSSTAPAKEEIKERKNAAIAHARHLNILLFLMKKYEN